MGHPDVAALQQDQWGALWVGTYGGGLYRLDPAHDSFTAYRHDPANPQSLSSDSVWAIAEDQHASIWIGTLGGGLNRLEPATGQITRYQHDPQNAASQHRHLL